MKSPIPTPCLCLVTDLNQCNGSALELQRKVAQAVQGGVNLVQLREKDLPAGQLLDLANELRLITQGSALFFVNDRIDVAMACGADGVQLGEKSHPVGAARKLVGDNLHLARSVHSLEGALAAEAGGADFLVVGSVFSTLSHDNAGVISPQLFARIADKTSVPLLGIGGVTAANVGKVIAAGASGAAVTRAILASDDPGRAARELREAIDAAWLKFHTATPITSVASAPSPKAGSG